MRVAMSGLSFLSHSRGLQCLKGSIKGGRRTTCNGRLPRHHQQSAMLALTHLGGDCWDGRDTATSIDKVGSGELKLSLEIPIESPVVDIRSCEKQGE